MKQLVTKLLAAVAVLAVAGTANSAVRHVIPVVEKTVDQTAAQAMFPDAPDGVDPMVTGPVSASFRLQQAQADCADAVWPNIPAACYPSK